MKTFVVDLNKCNGCYACQLACKDENVGNAWPPYSKPEPNTGQFWLKMYERTHGQVPKVRIEYRPMLCRHCEYCPLIEAAPEAVYRREDGLVIIDPEKAVGRKDLVHLCSYGAVYWNEDLNLAQKCTGCAHLVDEGELPHCVDACATGALRFGDEEEFADEIAQDTGAFNIADSGSRVHYLNPFGFFISGEVWDPEADLIIEGAKVTLRCPSGEVLETETDGFGDFWFKHLNLGEYVLNIEAPGFKGVKNKPITLQESLNIGDFPLEKE